MDKKFFIGFATATALAGGAIGVGSLTAVASTPKVEEFQAKKILGPGAKATVEAWVAANTCDQVEEAYPNGETCTVPRDLVSVYIAWSPDKTEATLYANYGLAGTWVWGEAE